MERGKSSMNKKTTHTQDMDAVYTTIDTNKRIVLFFFLESLAESSHETASEPEFTDSDGISNSGFTFLKQNKP